MKESQYACVVPSTILIELSRLLPLSCYRERTVHLYANLQPLKRL